MVVLILFHFCRVAETISMDYQQGALPANFTSISPGLQLAHNSEFIGSLATVVVPAIEFLINPSIVQSNAIVNGSSFSMGLSQSVIPISNVANQAGFQIVHDLTVAQMLSDVIPSEFTLPAIVIPKDELFIQRSENPVLFIRTTELSDLNIVTASGIVSHIMRQLESEQNILVDNTKELFIRRNTDA